MIDAPAAPLPGQTSDAAPAPSVMPTLEQVRGRQYPDVSAPAKAKVDFVARLWGEGETEALNRYRQATHNVLYANGKQWISWRKSQRSWDEIPLADGELRVTMNYVVVILRARIQRLVSSEVNWRGIPESNAYEARDRVKVGINFIKARYHGQELEHKVRQGLFQASQTGFVALKSFWNPSIGPLTAATMFFPEQALDEMGAPLFDEAGQPVMGAEQVERFVDAGGQPVEAEDQAFMYRPGDTDTAIRTVFNIRLNPEAQGWTEAEGLRWLIDSEVVPLAVAKEKFPKIALQIAAMDGGESYLTYERIAQGSATTRTATAAAANPVAAGVKSQDPSQQAVIREYWEMRSPFFPKGRLIVTVGGAEAYDGPWPHGVFPYAPLFGEPATMTPYGRPPVNDLIPPQNVINQEWTAIVKEQKANGTGRYVAWAIPGVPDQISKDDDQVIQIPTRSILANRPIHDVFQRLNPASVSPDRWRLIDQAKATLFDIGAYHEVSRGQIPPGLDSGVAIQYLLEQEAGQLKDAVEAIKRSLISWARHQLAIARWGYGEGEERWIPVDRPDLGYMIEGVSGEKLPDPETMGLDVENFRPQSESATRAETKELMGMGVIDPRKALRIMDLGGGFEEAFESQTRHYSRARRENLDYETGQYVEQPTIALGPTGAPVQTGVECIHLDGSPFLLPEDDDHAIHVDTHNEIALDSTQPWPVRQKVLAHIAAHRQAAQMQAVQAAQLQAATNPQPAPAGGPPQEQQAA